MDEIVYKPIGVIRSPHKEVEGMPIQPSGAKGVRGTVELKPEFAQGLKDLGDFSYVMLLYHFHRSHGYSLETKTFLDDRPHGVFATRVPRRPNAIGVSVVRIEKLQGNIVEIEDVDILDGTPLLDIKPFVPDFDNREPGKIGWLSDRVSRIRSTKSDDRFK
jgi:tRNA (adenine37-N6)-methyltransferase